MIKQFPYGRWNRDLDPHRIEMISQGAGYWFECSCGAQGEVHHYHGDKEKAEAEAEAHEREVFAQRRAGRRFVRGRWEDG